MNGKLKEWFLLPRSAGGTSDAMSAKKSAFIQSIYTVLCIILGGAILFGFLFLSNREWEWESVLDYKNLFIKGWFITLGVSFFSLLISFMLGALLAYFQMSRWRIFRALGKVVVEFFRGTPLLVQIMFFFYVVADGLGIGNRYVVGVLTLSLYAGTYIAEILRGGIQSAGKAQMLASTAIGMTQFESYRYIIIPQTIRAVLPSLAGQFVALIKNSSLLSVIAVEEYTYVARSVNSITYSTLESYLPLLFGYFILTLAVSLLSKWIEKKLQYEN